MEIRFLDKPELQRRLPEFCELYRRCFNGYIDEKIVRQRYIEHPDDDLIMCVAFDKGKIVANRSAIPGKVFAGGKLLKCALSLNVMTHPDYAGRGMLVELSELLYARFKETGYVLKYGFPNTLSNRVYTSKLSRLGYKSIYEIPTFQYDVIGDAGLSPFTQCQFRELVINDTRAKCHIYKDERYIHWRYESAPDRAYYCAKRGDNWVIYKFYDKEINVVDMQLHEPEMVVEMFNYLKGVACQHNMNKITLWSQINTPEHYYFEKLGFVNRQPIRYFGGAVFAQTDVDLLDYRNWSVVMGDDNVY